MADRVISIAAQGVSAQARLNDSSTADAIWNALPIKGSVNTWGDEIYFSIPVDVAAAPDAGPVVNAGDLAYWPPGTAFCIFFGPTPASRGSEIRAASAVNVFGKIQGDPGVFKTVPPGAPIVIEKS